MTAPADSSFPRVAAVPLIMWAGRQLRLRAARCQDQFRGQVQPRPVGPVGDLGQQYPAGVRDRADTGGVDLDEGRYLCSVSTMYRLLRARGEVRERRAQATHPARVKPELVATAPNCVWSWDITKLADPAKWTYYYLYSIIDIYSRYTVGWMVATAESMSLAERLLAETIAKQDVDRNQLTIHADNGSSMASKPVAQLLADLGVTKSHSRPHVSNDCEYGHVATGRAWPI